MRRVVVTGLGVLSPVGNSVEETWNALLEGKNGIAPIQSFDVSNFGTKIAGELKGFDPENHGMDKKEARRLDLFSQYGLAVAKEAIDDCGIDLETLDKERAGVSLGVGFGGIKTFQDEHEKLMNKGPRRVSPFMVPMMIANMGAGNISIKYGLKGPQYNPVAACASGTFGIGEAFRAIKEGIADFMVAGGAEAAVHEMGIAGFITMKALSTRNDEPEKASRPFDKDRDGFVPGEGAGVLILEEYEHAKKRGAKIYAEVAGYGVSSDAYHITQPAPEGDGPRRAMEYAIKSAGITPDKVDYINAHGTSTYFNDMNETKAIKYLFGDHAKNLKVNSTKSMTGHLLGAAGGLEGAVTVLSIYHQKVHPTRNLETPDEGCDLDYVAGSAQDHKIEYALSNSLGFGGVNGVVLFKKFSEE